MANIPVYENQDVKLQPSNIGVTSFEQLGHQARLFGEERQRSAQQVGSQISHVFEEAAVAERQNAAEQRRIDEEQKANAKEAKSQALSDQKSAEKVQASQEISAGYLDMAFRDANHTRQANALFQNANPNDYGAKAHELVASLEPEKSEFMQQFTTPTSQQFGERIWAQHLAHAVGRYTADADIVSSYGVANNIKNAIDLEANTVYNDPSSFDKAAGRLKAAVYGATDNPNLDPKRAAESREKTLNEGIDHLAGRAAQKEIELDPSQRENIVGKYAQYLSPRSQQELLDHGAVHERAEFQRQQAATVEGVQQTRERSLGAAVEHVGTMTDPQGAYRATPDATIRIVGDPRMQDTDKAALLSANQRMLDHGDGPTVHDALVPFINDIAKGNAPSLPQVMSHVGQDISFRDAQFLLRGISPDNPNAQQEFSALNVALSDAQRTLSPHDPGAAPNPAAENAYGRFVDWFMPQIRQVTANGGSIAAATDPSSPDYILKDNKVQTFAPTHEDAIATRFAPQNQWKASLPPGGDVRFNWAAHPQTVEEAEKITWGQHPPDMTGVQLIGGWLQEGSKALPAGYSIVVTSTTDHSKNVHGGGESQHTEGKALDFQIQDVNGQPIRNRGADSTGLYRRVADEVRRLATADGLGDQLAWGGNFTTEAHGGQKDIMHLDLGGNRGDGTWDKPAARPSLDDIYAGHFKGASEARNRRASPTEAPPIREEPVAPPPPEEPLEPEEQQE